MNVNDIKTVQRFIDGEKRLISKIATIHSKLKNTDQEFEAAYLRAYFSDNEEEVKTAMSLKRKIQEQMKKKYKPSFQRRKDK